MKLSLSIFSISASESLRELRQRPGTNNVSVRSSGTCANVIVPSHCCDGWSMEGCAPNGCFCDSICCDYGDCCPDYDHGQCAAQLGSCFQQTGGTSCPSGLEVNADETACIDIDECANGSDNCNANQICENAHASFICNDPPAPVDVTFWISVLAPNFESFSSYSSSSQAQDIVSDKNVAGAYNSLTIAILSEEKPSNNSKIVVAGKESTSPMEITVKKFLNDIDEEIWIDKPKLVIVNAPRGGRNAASSKTSKRAKKCSLVSNNSESMDFQWSLDRDWAFFWSTLEGNRINKATNSSISPFITILWNEFNEAIDKKSRKDIYEIYLAVQKEMLILESENQPDFRNQVCEFRSTLRKKLILTDKLQTNNLT
ncbi:unnamed protein product [Oikopleura dioica]|uniref:SMB domain-containing protein n=1 Tax=Oikopleura dioica TaxID=34765 RepID=E4YZK9_OIKDI|nr:unnamed protein product [Oikopleura dioica]